MGVDIDSVRISDPVVVGRSRPHETRWGYFQFPGLCRLPSGDLMVTVNDAEDATSGYGKPLRRFTSSDEGESWQEMAEAAPGFGPHATCAELFEGECQILAASPTFDLAAAGLHLPPPVSSLFVYSDFRFYKVSECPAPLQQFLTRLRAWRWTPARPTWTPEEVAYHVDGHLCWTFGEDRAVSHTWFEHPPIRHGGELLDVDYRTNCLQPDGSPPDGFSCLLMASSDNGRSFHKRSVLAAGRVYEPMLTDTATGELVCAIRSTDHEQRPMLVTYSSDRGYTWETPRVLFESGVFPALVRLGCGALLLAFGRPGVWVSASLDGKGRTWTYPAPIMGGNLKALEANTCGYTNLLPVGDSEALIVYSNFQHLGPDGQPYKSIEVRRITVRA